MKTENINFSEFQDDSFDLNGMTAKMNRSNLYAKREGYLNEFTLYHAHFNAIPNYMEEKKINCKRANAWFLENYKSEIRDAHYSKRYYNGNNSAEYDDMFYFLFDDLMVDFDTNSSWVRFLFRKTAFEKVETIVTGIKKFRERKTKYQCLIGLLVNGMSGIEIKVMEIPNTKLNLQENYNDDFEDIHQTILKRLSNINDKGLVLLHGKPGTGKTSYIRYLLTKVRKQVIFLPPDMAEAITNPSLLSLLMIHSNSIIVIEDAENIIVDREKNGRSPVSALLNLSDGLLSDCLNIQIICTFNTDISKVDNALMRKGRLIAKYEFKELEADKANALSSKLGFAADFNTPISLANIYNQDDKDYQNNGRQQHIGFLAEQAN
jgi:hypothetical protein